MENYRIPKNYLTWLTFLKHKDIVNQYPPVRVEPFSTSGISKNLSYLFTLWGEGYPVYCIRENLLEDMLKTDVSENIELFSEINLAIPALALFLLTKKVESPSGNAYINYIVVAYEKVNYPEHKYLINWGGIDSADNLIFSSKKIRRDGTLQKSFFLGDNQRQHENAVILQNIVLQAILLLQYYPKLEEEMKLEELQPKAKGFAKPDANVRVSSCH